MFYAVLPNCLSETRIVGCKKRLNGPYSPNFLLNISILTLQARKICPHPTDFSQRCPISERLLDGFTAARWGDEREMRWRGVPVFVRSSRNAHRGAS